jgi:hypothetical protein
MSEWLLWAVKPAVAWRVQAFEDSLKGTAVVFEGVVEWIGVEVVCCRE